MLTPKPRRFEITGHQEIRIEFGFNKKRDQSRAICQITHFWRQPRGSLWQLMSCNPRNGPCRSRTYPRVARHGFESRRRTLFYFCTTARHEHDISTRRIGVVQKNSCRALFEKKGAILASAPRPHNLLIEEHDMHSNSNSC